jgi:hypothetical protein
MRVVHSPETAMGQFELFTGDQDKIRTGAHRGPRVGWVVATSQRLGVDSLLWNHIFSGFSAVECRAGRYDHPTRAAGGGPPAPSQF